MIVEPDDVEDTKNSGISANPEVRQAVIDTCDQNENLLRDGGFINISGTRYHPFDWYGRCIDRAAKNPEAWKILIRSSILLKHGGRILPGEFPSRGRRGAAIPQFANLSYGELAKKFYNNYEASCASSERSHRRHVSRFPEKNFNAAQIEPKASPARAKLLCAGGHAMAAKTMAKYQRARLAASKMAAIYMWIRGRALTPQAAKRRRSGRVQDTRSRWPDADLRARV